VKPILGAQIGGEGFIKPRLQVELASIMGART
jgi:hypothetical protein